LLVVQRDRVVREVLHLPWGLLLHSPGGRWVKR